MRTHYTVITEIKHGLENKEKKIKKLKKKIPKKGERNQIIKKREQPNENKLFGKIVYISC
jgi:predicted site-specific integrase-resolvase